MSAAKPKFTPDPRTWNEFQVAARLNRGPEWFRKNRPVLESEGFPRYDKTLGGWDAKAIDLWYDSRSGLSLTTNDDEAAALKAIRARAS